MDEDSDLFPTAKHHYIIWNMAAWKHNNINIIINNAKFLYTIANTIKIQVQKFLWINNNTKRLTI